MKSNPLLFALLLTLLPAPAALAAPSGERITAAPAGREPTAASRLLIAQDRRMPTCQNDNREVPTGTTMCREKRVWVCENGSWRNTGKNC